MPLRHLGGTFAAKRRSFDASRAADVDTERWPLYATRRNLDALLAGVNAGAAQRHNASLPEATAMYSTPGAYATARAGALKRWPRRDGDFLPYADRAHAFWTGAHQIHLWPPCDRCDPGSTPETLHRLQPRPLAPALHVLSAHLRPLSCLAADLNVHAHISTLDGLVATIPRTLPRALPRTSSSVRRRPRDGLVATLLRSLAGARRLLLEPPDT